MHLLQKQILDKLRLNSDLRYSELQPKDIESSHFKYHLNQLIKDGLVEQVSRGVYRLSDKGVSSVDLLSAGRIHPHATPKVITYTLLYDKTNYYLQTKTKEPYKDLLNLVGGKLHIGETSLEAAKREVYEKVGLESLELKFSGVAEIQITKQELMLSHVIAYIFVADITGEQIERSGLESVPKSRLNEVQSLAPDLLELVEAIEGEDIPFTTNISINL